ncbi:MAG TPA: GDSL-type esterase/lipase family protein [Gemmatimonadaceae bacterium]|nr:GDSL-type esterase/lipase family protein [Gemmatimonadaceae bacterium]
MTSDNLVLFGDSILDNAPYTGALPDTTTHLRRLLPGWSVDLLAQDGAAMADIPFQLHDLRAPVSVAVLSVGGNDAVEHVGLLEPRTIDSAQLLRELLHVADDFQERYESVARDVAAVAERTIVCTIYEVQLEPRPYAELARVPLALLNDRIVRTAGRLGLDVLELRSVCTDPADFVKQIEPSPQGAEKIANAVAGLVTGDGRLTAAHVFSA